MISISQHLSSTVPLNTLHLYKVPPDVTGDDTTANYFFFETLFERQDANISKRLTVHRGLFTSLEMHVACKAEPPMLFHCQAPGVQGSHKYYHSLLLVSLVGLYTTDWEPLLDSTWGIRYLLRCYSENQFYRQFLADTLRPSFGLHCLRLLVRGSRQ